MSFIKRLGTDLRRNRILLLMSLPGLALLILFRYVPMYGILIAFKKYQLFKGFFASPWCGFANFISFFNDPFFFRLVRNTFLLGLYGILWTFPAPIVLALVLNEVHNSALKRFTQTVSYIPYFVSTVIIVGLLKVFFSADGIVNSVVAVFGGKAIIFFNQPGWFRSLYIGSDIWQTIGYGSIIYLAAITGIDQEMYEAARIDGASRAQSIAHITIPCLIPTISILLIMRVGSILSVGFDKIYLMYSPATYETADVISTYVYRRGITQANYGFGTAVGLFNSVIGLIFVVGANYFSRAFLEESLW